MKSILKSTSIILLSVLLLLSFSACGAQNDKDVWKDAIYTEDTTLGEGETVFTLQVEALDKTLAFTVKTNEKTVGEALLKCGLIEGDEGQYGLYIKEVNGILADYDVNKRYWAFYINDEYAMTGVDTTEIKEGDTYSLVYEK
ncbi:MAG: DUF4430 domain-containing protein [Clostridia bacterium]|nr:DUF4430 domain-containing protein [Clostridia bacterium]